MTPERMADVYEVTQLLYEYCVRVDANRQRDVLDLFTEDAVYDHGHGRVYVGRTRLAELFAAVNGNEATSHHLSNVMVTFSDADTAHSYSYVYAYHRRAGSGREVHLWGRYADTLVRTPNGWRISHRRLLAAAERGVDPDPGWTTRYQLIDRVGR